MESLAAEILSIIAAADGPLRARDILEVFESRGQEADKKAINQTLYSDLAEKVEKVNGNQWQLAEPNAPSARPEAETNSSDSPEVTTPLTAALSDTSGVEPEWRFERVGAQGKDRGGITAFEVFRQQNTLSPLEVLVRESIQNSCDARQEDLPADVPVRVNFHLRELNGAAATSFLDAMGWDSLSPHVESTASQAGTLQDRIERDGLSQVKDLSIRVMTIADYGTEGLWGEEGVDGPVEGNFHRLVRAEMKTHEEGSSTTGGSFGLGKAIYWMTSGVSTVLLHSVPANAINAGQQRLIGCTWLPSHTTGDGKLWNSDGGWFGAPDEDVDGRPRTVSLWSEDAADTADALGIPRAQGEYGTSFAIVAFDNPDEDDEPDVAATCDALRRFVVKWYWPAICAKSLRVSVTGQVDDKVVFDQEISTISDDHPLVGPFVAAWRNGEPDSTSPEGFEYSHGNFDWRVPSRNKEPKADELEVGARIDLALIPADSTHDEESLANSVAYMRGGTGMVVRYHEPNAVVANRFSETGKAFHGVLRTGEAHGSALTDTALEVFLRAAEPPAHDRWSKDQERVKQEYHWKGGSALTVKTALDKIDLDVNAFLREQIKIEAADGDRGPEHLLRLFQFGKIGPGPNPEPTKLLRRGKVITDGTRWTFEGASFGLTGSNAWPEKNFKWDFRLAATIPELGSDGSQPMRITHLEILDETGKPEGFSPGDVEAQVIASDGVARVKFTVTVELDGVLLGGRTSRVAARLRADTDAKAKA